MYNPRIFDYSAIIKEAWKAYDSSRPIEFIEDFSPKVSTNHVYKVVLNSDDNEHVFAKLSYFGHFNHFKEDHNIINSLATNLPSPYENFLSRSMVKGNEVFIYRYEGHIDAWVVFYNPIRVDQKLPKRLETKHIKKLGAELAKFHKACNKVKNVLPKYSKTLRIDIEHLMDILKTERGVYEHRMYDNFIRWQCELFLANLEELDYENLNAIPVFVDWNIGNFSVTKKFEFFSRWDYDWFRVSNRVLDFYFFSRVVSDMGDKTVFSYTIDQLMEDRFILFLKEYHKVYPLSKKEVLFMKEAYRFFILNYVIKDGRYFFHELYASRLQQEAYDLYFPSIDAKFNADKILKALKI